MAKTEDEITRDLRRGLMTVDEVLEEFRGNDVLVYPDRRVNRAEMSWDEREDAAAGLSGLFAALANAGASEEQMDDVGANIIRLREQGRIQT